MTACVEKRRKKGYGSGFTQFCSRGGTLEEKSSQQASQISACIQYLEYIYWLNEINNNVCVLCVQEHDTQKEEVFSLNFQVETDSGQCSLLAEVFIQKGKIWCINIGFK